MNNHLKIGPSCSTLRQCVIDTRTVNMSLADCLSVWAGNSWVHCTLLIGRSSLFMGCSSLLIKMLVEYAHNLDRFFPFSSVQVPIKYHEINKSHGWFIVESYLSP